MLVCYRDDTYWTLRFYVWSRILIGGRKGNLPGPGFVGRGSLSFLDKGADRYRLSSTRMRRLRANPSISGAPLWRLTCVWAPSRGFREILFGSSSEDAGN